MSATISENQSYWMRQAARLSRRINLAWFLDGLSGPLLITAVIGSVAVLSVRREFPTLQPWILPASLIGLIVILTLVNWLLVRRRFETPKQALVRIEASKKLNSALSAASAGIVPWPERPLNLSKSLQWHLPKTLTPPFVALLILVLGLLIPISPKNDDNAMPSGEPQAWSQLSSELEKLSQDAMVDEKYIEDTKERLEQLRAQEEEDWFSHSSLEATDSLKEAHQSSIQDLQQNLSEATQSINDLTDAEKQLNSEQKQKLMDQFQEALEGMKNGTMKPNQKLMDQLSNLDPKELGQLNPEQLQQLKENMENLQESLEQANEGDDWSDQLGQGDGDGGQGDGSGNGDGNQEGEGEGSGNGGVDRGPGHDPNVLRKPKDPLDVGDKTGLQAQDLSKSLPGDLLELQNGKHTVDKAATPMTSGGQGAQGAGGDRVWKESLSPDEQRALKNYFK